MHYAMHVILKYLKEMHNSKFFNDSFDTFLLQQCYQGLDFSRLMSIQNNDSNISEN